MGWFESCVELAASPGLVLVPMLRPGVSGVYVEAEDGVKTSRRWNKRQSRSRESRSCKVWRDRNGVHLGESEAEVWIGTWITDTGYDCT